MDTDKHRYNTMFEKCSALYPELIPWPLLFPEEKGKSWVVIPLYFLKERGTEGVSFLFVNYKFMYPFLTLEIVIFFNCI